MAVGQAHVNHIATMRDLRKAIHRVRNGYYNIVVYLGKSNESGSMLICTKEEENQV